MTPTGAKHAKAVGESATISMKEGLLFNGITLHAAYIAPGNVERSTPVEADFADSRLAIGYGAAMSAGIAAHPVAVQLFV
jgi:hypothetical protein